MQYQALRPFANSGLIGDLADPRYLGAQAGIQLALHTWTLDTTPLAEVLRIARTTGWDAIELRRVDFKRAAERGQSASDVLDLVKRSGLPVACLGVEVGWMFAEGDERRRLLDAFDESCRWAAALGCATVMSPADRGRGPVERAARSLREVGDRPERRHDKRGGSWARVGCAR